MEPFRLHVYVCDQRKPDGVPCCSQRGSLKVIDALRREVAKAGLGDEVQVTTSGSLGLCTRGPNMVVYPDGVWYSGVNVEDVPEIVREHFAGGRPVERLLNRDKAALTSEIDENKKKMLAALAAQDAAGALPEDFHQLIRGFQVSRALLTAIELDVFTKVGGGARGDEVAAALGTNPRATGMLLDAMVALELLSKKDGVFANSPMAARYLAAGAKDDARAALMHSAHLWPRWSTLTECVRRGTSVTYSEMAHRGDEWTDAFIAAMHRNASARAPALVNAVGAAGAKRMLDIGGGSGAYSIAFARANPELRAEVFDLQTVVPIAARHIEAAGLTGRVSTRAGDLRTDDFGSGHDLIFLSAICHMLGPEANADLFKRCFLACAPGGRIVIQDFILGSDRTSPKTGALFALNMLVGTKEGGSYTDEEYRAWLGQAGFADIEDVRLPGPTALVIGKRP